MMRTKYLVTACMVGLAIGHHALGQATPATPAPPGRAVLGVEMADNAGGGALILRVIPGSPAAAIGLKIGDRITAIGGRPVSNYRDVAKVVAGYKPKMRVGLIIDRGGRSRTFSVVFGNVTALAVPIVPPRRASVAPTSTRRPLPV
jgi:S1-C subfamily serine protease